MSRMKHLTYGQAEYWARTGLCTNDEWTAYKCLWRNSAPKLCDLASNHEGHDPEQCPLVGNVQEPHCVPYGWMVRKQGVK